MLHGDGDLRYGRHVKNEGRLATALVACSQAKPCESLSPLAFYCSLLFALLPIGPAVVMLHLLVMMPVTIAVVVMMRRRRIRQHHERAHHLVILVLDDVAMPCIEAREVELDSNGCNLSWIGNPCVLKTRLSYGQITVLTWRPIEGGSSNHFESDRVQVDRMGIRRKVIDLPLLDIAEFRRLRDVHRKRGFALQRDFRRLTRACLVRPLQGVPLGRLSRARDGSKLSSGRSEGSCPLTTGGLHQVSFPIQHKVLFRIDRYTHVRG